MSLHVAAILILVSTVQSNGQANYVALTAFERLSHAELEFVQVKRTFDDKLK